MTPTRWRTLVLWLAVAGATAYLLLAVGYASLPPLRRTWSVSLYVLAVVELFLAPSIRARLAGRPRTKPIMPIAVARTAALAKASSAVGAISTGGWLALVTYTRLHVDDFRTARADSLTGLLGLAGSGLLIVAALLLERACRVPRPPRGAEDDADGAPPAPSGP